MDMEIIMSPEIQISINPAVIIRHGLIDGEQYWIIDFSCSSCSGESVSYHRSAVRIDVGDSPGDILDEIFTNIKRIISSAMEAEHRLG